MTDEPKEASRDHTQATAKLDELLAALKTNCELAAARDQRLEELFAAVAERQEILMELFEILEQRIIKLEQFETGWRH